MSKNHISFILHKPQLSENIGACARAIKNFNFKKLILINPKPIFPNDKILPTSVGAKDILVHSKNYNTLAQALDKINILITTSIFFKADSKLSKFLLLLIIFFAPTDVAKILSLGKIGFGSITIIVWKLKFFIALAYAPIFSDSCGLLRIKEILFLLIYLLAGALSLKSL